MLSGAPAGNVRGQPKEGGSYAGKASGDSRPKDEEFEPKFGPKRTVDLSDYASGTVPEGYEEVVKSYYEMLFPK